MDALSVDPVSVISDCSLELMSDDTDLQESKRSEYLKPITNEGLILLGDDCSLKQEECLQGLPPFLSSSMHNKAACHPGEEIWDKFEFPNNAATERKTITNVSDDTKKCEKGNVNDWAAEIEDEPRADVFPNEIYIKEDVMWCPKMLTLAQVQNEPVGEISEAELADTPNNLLQQTPLSHCVSTMKSEEKCSPLKIDEQKCIVRMSSGNPQSSEVEKKAPTVKCFVPSPNALHGVTSNNSLILFTCSNSVLTSSTDTHLKNAILNTEQHQHFVTPPATSSYAFTAKNNMVKANCSNTVVAKSPTKYGLNNKLTDASAFSVPRKEQSSSMSNGNSSVENAYLSKPPMMVECSKRKGKGVRCGKKHSLAYTDEETDYFVKRYIRNEKMKRKREILQYKKLMEQLRTVLPATEHMKRASRAVILREAIRYCMEIPHIMEEKQKKLHELQSQRKNLYEALSLLELEMAVKRARHSVYRGSV